ncbi:MAG TPA: hypothetical protein VEX43_00930 [Chthoniobacterales bacterium]|nr:hypothetical protein [Chthoniobacterales bacterium]
MIAAIALVALAISPVSGEAQGKPPSPAKAETDSQRIAFVHLRFTGAQVQLVEFKVVPGRFKTAPEPAGERILLQVVGSSGKPLWEGWVNDPRTRVLEFEDSRRPGRRAGMAIAVPNPEVVVRVPFIEEGQALHIWSVTPAKGSGPHYQRLNTVLLREQ